MFEPALVISYIVAGILFITTLTLTLSWEKITDWRKNSGINKNDFVQKSLVQLEQETNRLTDSALILKEIISNYAIAPRSKSWIDFSFEVFNISRFPILVGQSVDGYIIFQGTRLFDKPVLPTPVEIAKGARAIITIRQSLLPEIAFLIEQETQKKEGFKVKFDFRQLQILIQEAKNPSKNGFIGILPLAKIRTYKVTQNNRLRGFYVWENAGALTVAPPVRNLPKNQVSR